MKYKVYIWMGAHVGYKYAFDLTTDIEIRGGEFIHIGETKMNQLLKIIPNSTYKVTKVTYNIISENNSDYSTKYKLQQPELYLLGAS